MTLDGEAVKMQKLRAQSERKKDCARRHWTANPLANPGADPFGNDTAVDAETPGCRSIGMRPRIRMPLFERRTPP